MPKRKKGRPQQRGRQAWWSRVAVAVVAAAVVIIVALAMAVARGGGDGRSVIQKMENARYDPQSQFIIATISYSGNHPEHIGCAAYGPDNTRLIIGGYTVLAAGKADYFTPVGRKPDGMYRLVCGERLKVGDSGLEHATAEPGVKTLTAEVSVTRDPRFVLLRQIRGTYRVPSYQITANSAPTAGQVRDLVIAFDFYEDGSMVRGGDVPATRFSPQPDGSYRAEEQTATPDLFEVITIRFDGEDAETVTEYRWRGDGTFTTRDLWRKVGPPPVPTATVVISLRDGDGKR